MNEKQLEFFRQKVSNEKKVGCFLGFPNRLQDVWFVIPFGRICPRDRRHRDFRGGFGQIASGPKRVFFSWRF